MPGERADGGVGSGVEDPDGLIGAASEKLLAVGGELKPEDRPAESANLAGLLAVVVRAPDSDQIVFSAAEDSLAVGMEGGGVDRLGVAREGHDRFLLGDVEDLARFIATGAHESLAVGA